MRGVARSAGGSMKHNQKNETYARRLRKEMKQVLPSNRKVKVGEYAVRLLPLELDVMFVLVHLLLHFIYEGIGLRQICDWACMLHKYKDDIDQKELEGLLRGVGCFSGAKIVGAMMVKYLAFPKNEFPFQISSAHAKMNRHIQLHISIQECIYQAPFRYQKSLYIDL